ncbi:MAG: signal peptide peptidase SppA [Spirochaeta sp.]|nr:signal peptide peptidase SppA [Spirochaeta sp.]
MKKITLLIIFSLLAYLSPAQNIELFPFSTAATDTLFAAKVNPAALSFGNAGGFGFLINSDFSALQDEFSLFFNFTNLAYILDQEEENIFHTVALSQKIIKNFYLGSALNWPGTGLSRSNQTLSLLTRPLDSISLSAQLNRSYEADVEYLLGFALRPLFFSGYLKDRLTLSADIAYKEEWQDPIFYLQSELADGLLLNLGYDPGEQLVCLNIEIALPQLQAGSITPLNQDYQPKQGYSYFNLSAKRRRSIIMPPAEYFFDYKPGPEIVEQKRETSFGPFYLVSGEKTIYEVLTEIEELSRDESVKGILFENHNLLTSYAGLLEIRDSLQEFKDAGKKIVFYYEQVNNLNYTLAASVADKIYLHPQGSIDLSGFSMSLPYLKELLAHFGIEVVNFRSHDYKTGANILSESSMTDEEREALEELITAFHKQAVEMINTGRSAKLSKPVVEIIDDGPYMIAGSALAAGLVDELIYQDQVEEKIRELFSIEGIVDHRATPTVRSDWSDEPTSKIALIQATGNIHLGKSRLGESIGSESLAQAIREARQDNSIEGIILRVDSPGGSALASDVIARELSLCRSGYQAKPVVVSMGGVAASGGYYISCLADKILAQPVTITGSIGVIGLTFNLEDLFEKIKVNWSNIKTGEHADLGVLYRPMSEEEKDIIRKWIAYIYKSFTEIVAEGRGLDIENVQRIAQGRVWSGIEAQKIGLIDEIGGYKTAIEVLKELASIKRDVELVAFPKRRGIPLTLESSLISEYLNIENKSGLPESLDSLLKLAEVYSQFGDERVLLILPYKFNW